jgi:hypothetical protein
MSTLSPGGTTPSPNGLALVGGDDPFDLDALRLWAHEVGCGASRKGPPRHRPGDPFIKGPIAYPWVASACRLPGAGLQVAMACRFLCCRFRPPNRWGLGDIAKGLQVDEWTARRGLHAAELAGLLVVGREPGCKLAISVLPGPDDPGPGRRPLRGPVPWSWWLPASRLPGRTPHVGAVCWLLAGWGRSAEFEFAWGDWAELRLSRSSASRGLDELGRAGLVSVARTSGWSPVVILRDIEAAGPPTIPRPGRQRG